MDLGLDQKVVFVTGASSGIGRATTLTFAQEGARVAIGSHTNESAARAVADTAVEHGSTGALPVQLDLADPPTLEHAVEVIRATLGPLQVLVNCAVWSPEWQPEGERFEEAPGFPANVSYGAAKAGRHGLTRFMSRELARAGILTTS